MHACERVSCVRARACLRLRAVRTEESYLFRLRLDGRRGSRRFADNEQLPVLLHPDLLTPFTLRHALVLSPHPLSPPSSTLFHPRTPTLPRSLLPLPSLSISLSLPLTGEFLSEDAVPETDAFAALIVWLSCLLNHLEAAPPPASCMHVIMSCVCISACVCVRQCVHACVYFSACVHTRVRRRVHWACARARTRVDTHEFSCHTGMHSCSPPLPELSWL